MQRLSKEADVFIVTYQPNTLTAKLTIQWLEEREIRYRGMIFTEQKGLIQLDYLLDDHVRNLEECKLGVGVCMDRPWNQEWQGLRVKGYDDFLRLKDVKQ